MKVSDIYKLSKFLALILWVIKSFSVVNNDFVPSYIGDGFVPRNIGGSFVS